MTELKGESKLTRKVQAWNRGKQLVVTLTPAVLLVRLERSRQAYAISYESVLYAAATLEADRIRAERAAARKARRKR